MPPKAETLKKEPLPQQHEMKLGCLNQLILNGVSTVFKDILQKARCIKENTKFFNGEK
jgi:hypothetical protein